MKLTITLLNEIGFDVTFHRDGAGGLDYEKVFCDFLGRPYKPHLSWFVRGPEWEPHFTAARGTPQMFRRWLPKVNPAEVSGVFQRAATNMVRAYAECLKPADPRTLEAEGWTAHWADGRVVPRWLRRVVESRELRIDARAIYMLATHILRHGALPTAACASVPAETFVRLIALRWKETDQPEMLGLVHFPYGCGAMGSDGELVMAHPPGWYTHTISWPIENAVAGVMPVDRLEAAGRRVERWLSRYPRRRTARTEEIPDWVMSLACYYGGEMIDLAFAMAAPSPANAPPTRPRAPS